MELACCGLAVEQPTEQRALLLEIEVQKLETFSLFFFFHSQIAESETKLKINESRPDDRSVGRSVACALEDRQTDSLKRTAAVLQIEIRAIG